MHIRIICSSCGAALSAPGEKAGQKSKCPKCAAPIQIPAIEQRPQQPAAAKSKSPRAAGQATPNVELDELASDPLTDLLNAELGSPGSATGASALAGGVSSGGLGGGLARPLGKSSRSKFLWKLSAVPSWMWIVGGGGASLILMLGILMATRNPRGNLDEATANPSAAVPAPRVIVRPASPQRARVSVQRHEILPGIASSATPGSGSGPRPTAFLKKCDAQVGRIAAEFQVAYDAFEQQVAGAAGEQFTQLVATKSPVPKYVERFQELAAANDKTPVAFQSLALICALSQFPEEYLSNAFQKASEQILRDFAAEPDLGELVIVLTGTETKEPREFIRRVLEATPDRNVRGMACLALAMSLQADPVAREASAAEIVSLLERVKKEFSDVPHGGSTLGKTAESQLLEMKNSAAGKESS